MALPFPRGRTSQQRVSWRRLLGVGLLAAALAGLSGLAIERWWFGSSDAAAAARVESLVRREFDGMTAALTAVASRIASDPAARDQAARPETARALFDLVANARLASPRPDDIAVTVYDAVQSEARAWSGRPSDIPSDRVVGPQQLFLTRTALGLRLVLVQPIVGIEGDTNGSRRGAGGAADRLSRAPAGAALAPAAD